VKYRPLKRLFESSSNVPALSLLVVIIARERWMTFYVPRKASCKRAMEDNKIKHINERHLKGNREDPFELLF